MMALSLIDLSLAANLLLIVIFSGYENFVSKIDIGDHPDRPGWMGALDFSGLKMKLIASIVAISAVALLRAFMDLSQPGVQPDTLEIFRGVTGQIHPGEVVALVGPSGSGKSSLLHICGLLEPPSAGAVFISGNDCSKMDDGERTRVRRQPT